MTLKLEPKVKCQNEKTPAGLGLGRAGVFGGTPADLSRVDQRIIFAQKYKAAERAVWHWLEYRLSE